LEGNPGFFKLVLADIKGRLPDVVIFADVLIKHLQLDLV
jgi:hypothetical protein